jgi:hypothetical protein
VEFDAIPAPTVMDRRGDNNEYKVMVVEALVEGGTADLYNRGAKAAGAEPILPADLLQMVGSLKAVTTPFSTLMQVRDTRPLPLSRFLQSPHAG